MTAALYDHGRNEFLLGNLDWVNDDIRVALIDTGTYTVDLANHQDMADVSGIVAQSAASLANKSASAGIADADDHVIASVTGVTVEALILYLHTGTPANDTLIAYIDDASVTGLPLTPNGGDVTIAFDSGANKIFKL